MLLLRNAIYEYTVEAWTDTFRGWRHEFATKFTAGIADLQSETLEGAKLLEKASQRATNVDDYARLRELIEKIWTAEYPRSIALRRSSELEVLWTRIPIDLTLRNTPRRRAWWSIEYEPHRRLV